MNTAVVSVKGCVCFVGILVICIVFAILFCRKGSVCMRLWKSGKYLETFIHIIREMAAGIKAYLKSAV